MQLVTAAFLLLAYGFILGLGFWASKKVSNKLDEWLLFFNKDYRKYYRLQQQKEAEALAAS